MGKDDFFFSFYKNKYKLEFPSTPIGWFRYS